MRRISIFKKLQWNRRSVPTLPFVEPNFLFYLYSYAWLSTRPKSNHRLNPGPVLLLWEVPRPPAAELSAKELCKVEERGLRV